MSGKARKESRPRMVARRDRWRGIAMRAAPLGRVVRSGGGPAEVISATIVFPACLIARRSSEEPRRGDGCLPDLVELLNPVGVPVIGLTALELDMHARCCGRIMESVKLDNHLALRASGIGDHQAEAGVVVEEPVLKAAMYPPR